MTWWKKSLVVKSSVILSVLFVIVVGVCNVFTYNAQKSSVYESFLMMGEKLRDQGNANLSILDPIVHAYKTGATPPSHEMEVLKRLINAMTDDNYIKNAYYIGTDLTEQGDKKFVKYLQVSDSLSAFGESGGSEYELDKTFYAAFQAAMKGKSLLSESYSDDYGTWISFFAPIYNNEGKVIAILGVDFDYGTVIANTKSLLWKNVIVALIISIIAIVLVIFFLRYALKPLKTLAIRAREAAEGDLTVKVNVKNENEIGQAAEAFNDMISSLRQLTIQINNTSNEVSQSSLSLKEMTVQAEGATKEIASAIQDVASGAETQLISSQESQRAMLEMALGINRIAESSSMVAELASDTSQLAENGEAVMNETVDQMNVIEQQVSSAVSVMQELNESSQRISKIVEHIFETAKQTNLLALNASIEAARAGEAGKGFAVVAQEIRSLAERSKQSSDEIVEILHGITDRSQEVTNTLTQSAVETRRGSELVDASGQSFRSILSSIKQVSGQVQEVSAASEQMSASSEEIAASMEELERMANTTAAHSEEVAASSQEQLAAIEEVASSSEQLQQMATELRTVVGKFKV